MAEETGEGLTLEPRRHPGLAPGSIIERCRPTMDSCVLNPCHVWCGRDAVGFQVANTVFRLGSRPRCKPILNS
jgi:hypothetical protein